MKSANTSVQATEAQELDKWQPLDLDEDFEHQLNEIEEKAKAAVIERMELRRELRLIGR